MGFSKLKKEREKKEKDELGWRKPQLENNHLNKPAYRSKHGDVKKKKKRCQNHTMWGRKVRKYRFL